MGKRLTDIPGVSVEPEMGKMAMLAQKAKKPYRDFVYAQKVADGRKCWFKASGAPIFDGYGKFKGYRGVCAEITRYVEAEQAARLAQSRLDEAAAHLTQPFVVYDAEDRVTAFNQAFTDLNFRDVTPRYAAARLIATSQNGRCAPAFTSPGQKIRPSPSTCCSSIIAARQSIPIACATAAGLRRFTARCRAAPGSGCGLTSPPSSALRKRRRKPTAPNPSSSPA